MTFDKNPYIFSNGADQTNTATLSIFGQDSKGRRLNLESYHDPIEASLKTNLERNITENSNISRYNSSAGILKAYYIISTSYAISLQFYINHGSSYRILGRISNKPTREAHDFSYSVSDSVRVETQVWKTTTTFILNKLSVFIHANELPVTDVLYVIINKTGKCSWTSIINNLAPYVNCVELLS